MSTRPLEIVGWSMTAVGAVVFWVTSKTEYSMPLVNIGVFLALLGGVLGCFTKK